MKDIENGLKNGTLNLLEQLDKTKLASDEQKAVIDSIVKLADENLKYLKGEDEIFNNDAERQKLYAEVEKLKAEARRSDRDIPIDNFRSWMMQIRPDQAANIIVILTITGIAVNMEKNGHILPDRLLKWGMKLFKA